VTKDARVRLSVHDDGTLALRAVDHTGAGALG
jgi:hypothetical protein